MPPNNNPEIEILFSRYGRKYKWLVTIGGLIGSMTMVLSATMVNVAIPSIMGAFGIGQHIAQWAATSFLATMVASQLLNNWMIEAFGQKLVFCTALSIFSLGAFVCASSLNIEMLVAGRILQGFSAGIIQPLVLATIITVFPANRRGFAVGMYGMGVTLAPSFGPWIGGLAIDALTWRHIFLVVLPLVFIALCFGLAFMPSKKLNKTTPDFDWVGYTLVALAILFFISVIGNGQRWGWNSDWTLLFLLAALASSSAFIYSQLKSRNPILDPTLFLNSQFTSAMLIAFAFGAGNFATNYAIPLFVQTIQGYTPTRAGLVLVPAGILLVSLIPLSGRLSDYIPSYQPIILGCMIFATAAFLMSSADVNTPYWSMAAYALMSRGAIGLVMPNMGKVAMSSTTTDKLNKAAGTYIFIRQLGGATGVAVTSVVIEMQTAYHVDQIISSQTSSNSSSRSVLQSIMELLKIEGIAADSQMSGALQYLGEIVYYQGRAFGFQDSFLLISFVFCIAIIPALLLGKAARK
ncbi:MAG: MFS transporter [Magnetovibrio sp.]|nr:MFS transporter [Magnetovibrio sp.]